MRAKSLALLVLALGCGLVASIGITQVMAKRNAEPMAQAETEPIFVATRNIPLGEPLNAQLAKMEEWPKDKIPPGAISKLEELDGVRSRTRLFAGEPILKSKLFGKGMSEPGVSPQIPKGYRVVSVRVDSVSGAASLILPGDRVDVLVHLLQNAAVGIVQPITRTILQNIKVFAVDAVVNLDNLDGDGKSIPAKTISLLLTPEQAQKVTLASELGTVRLVLRSPDDDQQAEVPGFSPRELFGMDNPADSKQNQSTEGKTEPKPEASASSPQQGFLDFLQKVSSAKTPSSAAPAPAETPVAAPPANPKFTMRLLLGTKMNEVVLEPDTDASGTAAGSGFWRSQENTPAGGPAASAAGNDTPAATAPGAPPAAAAKRAALPGADDVVEHGKAEQQTAAAKLLEKLQGLDAAALLGPDQAKSSSESAR